MNQRDKKSLGGKKRREGERNGWRKQTSNSFAKLDQGALKYRRDTFIAIGVQQIHIG